MDRLSFLGSLPPIALVLVIGIQGIRCPIDPVDEKPDDILNLSLVLDIILCPRFGIVPDSYSHRQTFREGEDALVRLVVADKE
jgi:hypothetical protein